MPYVYVFQSGDESLFKIGHTKGDIEKRRKSLSTGNPHPLKLFDLIETDQYLVVEQFLHSKFHKHQVREGENREHFAIDEDSIREGLEEARHFLEGYIPLMEEADRLSAAEVTEETIEADDEIITIYRDLCRVNGELKSLEFEKDVLENRLKIRIGNRQGIDNIATWKSQTRKRLDTKALREEHPDIAEKYMVTKVLRFFRLQ